MSVELDLSELAQAYSEIVGTPAAVRVVLDGGSWSLSLHPTGGVYDDRGLVVVDRSLSKAIEVAQSSVLTFARKKRIEEVEK